MLPVIFEVPYSPLPLTRSFLKPHLVLFHLLLCATFQNRAELEDSQLTFTWHQRSLELKTKSRANEFTDINDCLGTIITLVTTRSHLEITRMIAYILQRLNVQYEPHTYTRQILYAPETILCYAACVLPLVLSPYYHISTWISFNDPDEPANFKLSPVLTESWLQLSSIQKEHTQLVWNGSSMILIQEKNHKEQKYTSFDEIPSFWGQDFSTKDGSMLFWTLGSVFR